MSDTRTTETEPPRPDAAAHLQAKRMRLDPYDVYVGPVGHLAEERARLAARAGTRSTSTWSAPRSAARCRASTSPGSCPTRSSTELRQALLDYKVLFFRDQPLTPAQHVAFARRFGPLETHPFIPSNTDEPELVRFAKSADVGGYENGWHHDVTWRACPSMGAVLHAIEVPPAGGDTLFADMYAAYDGLDPTVQDRIDGLAAVHDYADVFGHLVPAGARRRSAGQVPAGRTPGRADPTPRRAGSRCTSTGSS